MNIKLKELKIKNYKEKIKKNLKEFGEIDILHSDDMNEDERKFITTFYNDNSIFRFEFPIYNSGSQKYFDSLDTIKREALNTFERNLDIFNISDRVKFFYSFNDEIFIIKCDFIKIKEQFAIFSEIDLPLLLYNEQKTAILTLYKLEYVLEISKWSALQITS